MKRLIALFLVVFVMSGAMAACAKSGEESVRKQSPSDEASRAEKALGLTPLEERTTLRVGFFSGSAHSMPWYIAEKEGFWDALNIDIEYVPFINGPAMVEANANWDIASAGAPGVISGQLGYDLKMIGAADYETNLGLFVRKDSPLINGSAEDWKGTTWLYPVGTSLHMTLLSALAKNGLVIDDVTSINMDVNSAMTAFKGGQGDGLAVWNAFYFDALDNGFIKLEDTKSLNDTNLIGILSTPEALEEKTDLIKTAYAAYYKTWEWAKSSDENMAKAIHYYAESCDEEGVIITEETTKKTMESFNCPTLQEAVQIMTETAENTEQADREITRAMQDLFVTMDFFIKEGKYTEEDKQKIMDENLVDASIAEQIADWLK